MRNAFLDSAPESISVGCLGIKCCGWELRTKMAENPNLPVGDFYNPCKSPNFLVGQTDFPSESFEAVSGVYQPSYDLQYHGSTLDPMVGEF